MQTLEENYMMVYVEKTVLGDLTGSDDNFGPLRRKFCTFREDYDDISNQIDFVICLGGDRTPLFQGSMPLVMAFYLDTLCFLTPSTLRTFSPKLFK